MTTMKSLLSKRPQLLLAAVGWLVALSLAACSRGPQTAVEAKAALPRAFDGKFRIEGESGVRTVRLSTESLRVRDEHTLEFGSVRFLLLNPVDSSVLMEDSVAARGTITVPGGEVRLEEVSGAGLAAEVRRASFTGTLAPDCQSAEASWQMDGRPASLKLRAVR